MTAAQKTDEQAEKPLPRLRKDVSIEILADVPGAFPSVSITDRVRATYYKVSWPQSGLLLLWRDAGTVAHLREAMLATYGVCVGEDDIAQMASFAFRHELSETDDKGGWQTYAASKAHRRHALAKTLMHNYLFFRVPLVHPDAMLRRMLPALQFVYSTPFWLAVAAIGAVGLYLTSRQWSDVLSAVERSFQMQGLFVFAAALLALKAVHELGHALTTVHYGCRVPSMGVAFMLGAPVLYTDTSDSWRLSNYRERLRIVMAGVAAELVVASMALCVWPFLPEGPVRQVCFGLATAAIAMSLGVNLNPFMRFDGYFALSDYWQVPNLQARAFDLACWRLRTFLFGALEPAPERFPPRTRRALIVYAYLVWIYRFFLYLGIAALVYYMAGKAIGILLGLFELAIFIIRPVWLELACWWKLRSKISGPRRALWACAAICAAALLCVPWAGSIESPAVLVAAAEQELHFPAPARVSNVPVREGMPVEAGELLFEAASPDLDSKLRVTFLKARLLHLRLSRLLGNDADRERAVILKREYKLEREKIEGLKRQRAALRVTAPFAGRISDVDSAVTPGVWVSPDQMLARITVDTGSRVHGLISDTDVQRVKAGARGVFIADQADLPAHPITLQTLAPASDGVLAEPILADVHGGRVEAAPGEQDLRARGGWTEARYSSVEPAPRQLVRGIVRVEAEAASPLFMLWRQIGRVLVREQGF